MFPKPQGDFSLAYPQATREELLRHLRELLEVTTEEKTPICTLFLEDWVSQSYCWSVFWIFLKIALAVGVITPIYSL